jgi:SAM-dependent methyltransferase
MFDSYAEIFAERGAAYHAAMATCPRARQAEFHAVLEPIRDRPPGLLCDLPSGGGYLAAHLPPGISYVGVDPSDDFIEACPAGLERIKADLTAVPLGDGSVDYIVSLAALHHEPDLPAVFGEMRRLLKRGGRAVIADVAVNTRPALFLNGFVDANNPMGHDGHFLDHLTADLIGAAGFDIVDDRLIDVPWQFEARDQAGAFCRQLFWMPSLTAETVADAMDREIGEDLAEDSVRVRWILRRIVCDVV